jgi:hypothetical protein
VDPRELEPELEPLDWVTRDPLLLLPRAPVDTREVEDRWAADPPLLEESMVEATCCPLLLDELVSMLSAEPPLDRVAFDWTV